MQSKLNLAAPPQLRTCASTSTDAHPPVDLANDDIRKASTTTPHKRRLLVEQAYLGSADGRTTMKAKTTGMSKDAGTKAIASNPKKSSRCSRRSSRESKGSTNCSSSAARAPAEPGHDRRMVQKLPFLWRNINYVLKVTCDLDILSRSRLTIAAMDGVRLVKRNPFSTIGGLDQSMSMFWQLELPEEDDLPVLLDSTSFSASVSVDQPSKIRLAEHFMLLEERKFGKLSKADASRIDHRLEMLVKSEAEFASKSRFGGVKTDDR